MNPYPYLEQVLGHSISSKITLLLDENLIQLKSALKDAGFKILQFRRGMPDSELKEMAEGTAIVTQNSKDFISDAVAFDYDILALDTLKFIDTQPDRTNQAVQKIVKAARETGIFSHKGHFLLKLTETGHELVSLKI